MYVYVMCCTLMFEVQLFNILQVGVTPLMVASEQGHLPVTETLLKHNATIELKNEVRTEHSAQCYTKSKI